MQYVLRGYGQLFIANEVVPGALILLGLIVLSPLDALLSFSGALLVTAWAMWRGPDPLIETGLYGVNGVLLGLLWLIFPEVSILHKTLFVFSGAIGMAAAMVPCARYLREKAWPITLFSAPYVLAAWSTIALLYASGLADRNQFRGSSELIAGRANDALLSFSSSHPGIERAEGLRQNGLGWVYYQQGNYGSARASFQRAAERLPNHADSYAGLGWAEFKMGRLTPAKEHFLKSAALNAWNADAWDGLGWIHYLNDDCAAAEGYFSTALRVAPFLGDARAGLFQCAVKSGDAEATRELKMRSAFINKNIAPGFQRLSIRTLICWALFLLAIAVHSRTSLAVVIVSLLTAAMASRLLPFLSDAMKDVDFIYNLAALNIALGGHYLKLNWIGIVWMAAATLLLALARSVLSGPLLMLGLPTLSLGFNAELIGSIVLFRLFETSLRMRPQTVPLEVAVKSPHAVRLWERKCAIAKEAWKRIVDHRKTLASSSR